MSLLLLWICGPLLAKAAPPFAPGFIQVTSVTHSTYYPTAASGIRTADGSGIGYEPMIGLKSALHDTLYTNMWLNSGTALASDYLQYDFGTNRTIGEMWVWNYNQYTIPNLYGGRGLKSVNIQYSTNGTAWTTLAGSPVTLAKASGVATVNGIGVPTVATNAAGGLPINFGGVSARYVKIAVAGDVGVGSWGGYNGTEQYAGLSEVRFYEPGAVQPYIQPGSVTFPATALGAEGTAKLGLGAIGGSVNVTGASFTAGQGGTALLIPVRSDLAGNLSHWQHHDLHPLVPPDRTIAWHLPNHPDTQYDHRFDPLYLAAPAQRQRRRAGPGFCSRGIRGQFIQLSGPGGRGIRQRRWDQH